MNGSAARFLRLGVSLSGLVVLGWVLTGQAAKPAQRGIPLPTDWSHSHVIFARPATDEQFRLVGDDRRYWQQWYRQNTTRVLSENPSTPSTDAPINAALITAASQGAWSKDLGTNATAGAANYPAKYSFSSSIANCGSAAKPDYVVYSTGLTGSGTQASVVAFDNLYSGCTGTVPTVYWAYNTGGQILTSPVLSLDGTQVAFVQTSAGAASLVLLKWQASATETVSSPGVPTSVSAALYLTCAAPCMTVVPLHNGVGGTVDDKTSSPYYDYSNDIVWVGGTNGWLHKLTGIFKGTPTEVTTGGFPTQASTAALNTLSNPVYDRVSKNVFIGDAGGFFHRVSSTTGVATVSAQLDFGAGLVQGPLLDVVNGLVYVFASSDGTATCTGGAACSAIYELTTTFLAGSTGAKVQVGNSVVTGSLPKPSPLYIGGFDSAYYSVAGATGNLYVCGNTGSDPTLYRVPVTGGVLGTARSIAALTPAASKPSCSPVTDFANPNTSVGKAERAFFSVQNSGRPCANKGCMMSFVTLPWQANTQYNVGQQILIFRTADNLLYINTAVTAGTSGATIPTWPAGFGVSTVDGTVNWRNLGTTTVTPLAGWTANTNDGQQARIFDGTNVEISLNAGRTGATVPTWNPGVGGFTLDNLVIWVNVGPWANFAVTETGGTGGIIIDNSVSTGTLAGSSQVYFFTLGNEVCGTSGTGGCAVQVSQSTLK
jgi:hypothetical protein